MSQTTYYELNKPTGSDLVNLLTDTFPNWDIVDNALHELDTRSICNATEVVSLGVHAISRLNTNTKFIKWIATANFTAGDTFTIDGDVVAASTPGGSTLGTNAYVTGAVVVACLNADNSAMTVYVNGVATADDADRLGGELPAYYAKESDMSDALTDISNIKALDGTTSIVGIGDGTLTGAISALKSDLTANKFANGVNLSSYTSTSNLYTFPSDGYIYVHRNGSDNDVSSVCLLGSDSITTSAMYIKTPLIAGVETFECLFVRKGMKCFANYISQTGYAYFNPLTN